MEGNISQELRIVESGHYLWLAIQLNVAARSINLRKKTKVDLGVRYGSICSLQSIKRSRLDKHANVARSEASFTYLKLLSGTTCSGLASPCELCACAFVFKFG